MLLMQATFFLVSLTAGLLAVVVHNEVKPLKDEGLNAFVTVEHWLVLLTVNVLLLRDTSMFSGENYWMADMVMLGCSGSFATRVGIGRTVRYAVSEAKMLSAIV